MHVGIVNPRSRGNRSRHSRRMRTRNFTYLARGPWHFSSSGATLPRPSGHGRLFWLKIEGHLDTLRTFWIRWLHLVANNAVTHINIWFLPPNCIAGNQDVFIDRWWRDEKTQAELASFRTLPFATYFFISTKCWKLHNLCDCCYINIIPWAATRS